MPRAFGLRDRASEHCIGEYACVEATVSTGLRWLMPKEAHACGARALVIGVAGLTPIFAPRARLES
jgi:hypothetical protein